MTASHSSCSDLRMAGMLVAVGGRGLARFDAATAKKKQIELYKMHVMMVFQFSQANACDDR